LIYDHNNSEWCIVCFFVSLAGLATAKGMGLFGGKTYKKNKNN